ncbi:MAG: CRISPR-associated helicase Cas3' [Thermoprotei archaeon]|nr:MAG: CRISPR-associated helicase Cas3' [Thermoprotei archaeon]
MGELLNAYRDMCRKRGWIPRKLIERGLSMLEDALDRCEEIVLFLHLPTGYGKSTVTEALVRASLNSYPFFSRVIHILPMRSIVDDLASRLSKSLPEGVVAAQHMGIAGSPFFAKKCVITTLDTFILNFSKIPASELRKALTRNIAHFDFARGAIYSSIVVFDEFHLFSGLGTLREEFKSLQSAVGSIVSLASTGVPVLILTATLPEPMEEYIKEELKAAGVEFKTISYSEEELDESVRESLKRRKISFTVSGEDAVKIVVEKAREKSVLIILNKVAEAVAIYNELKKRTDSVVLIHGKLPERYKKVAINRLLEEKPRIVVSTQVVEAGVDISYDVLISAPCPADRLVQRSGRVARRDSDIHGEVVVSLKLSRGPYDKEVTERTIKVFSEKFNGRTVPKLDFELTSRELIKQVYRGFTIDGRDMYRVITMLDENVLLDTYDVKYAINVFCGFTDSFGLVSAYPEFRVENDLTIGISEREAKHFLRKNRTVVTVDGTLRKLSDTELHHLTSGGCLAVKMILNNIEGIIVDSITYREWCGDYLEELP